MGFHGGMRRNVRRLDMNSITKPTNWARIYISGPLNVIEQTCREFCLRGQCVTVEPIKFIYTRGEEQGAVVGLINYPRFPTPKDELKEIANSLAIRLLEDTLRASVLVMTPEATEWITIDDYKSHK